MDEPFKHARRYTNKPDPEGWSAADVPDEERVGDDFIAADVSDLRTATRAYEPLAPEDERLFPPVAD